MRNVYVKNNKVLVLLKNETKQHNMTLSYVIQSKKSNVGRAAEAG